MRGGRIPYSAAELAFVKANCTMTAKALASAFNEKFARDLTPDNLKSLRTRNGWEAGRKGKGIKRAFTPEQLAWLEANRTLPIADFTRAFNAAFDANLPEDKLHGARKRYGLRTGRTGQFVKGQEPWSKGRKLGNNPGSARTQFKPGTLPHNTKHLGHERVNADGYVEISVAETNPHTGYERRYVHKHKHLWEQANGPTPDGHVLKCVDGNRLNTDPSNWEAIPRAALPHLSGRWNGLNYNDAPAELKPAIMAIAKLKHASKKARQS